MADIDLMLGGRLKIRQPAAGHRAGTDTVLLAASAGQPETCLVDLGAGVGTVGLAVALRSPGVPAVLIDIDDEAVGYAQQNVALNGLSDRVRAVAADALSARARRRAHLDEVRGDLLVTNPPWFAPGRTRISPDAGRARAHTAAANPSDPDGLQAWLRACAALLMPGGRLVAILHIGQLASLLTASTGRFGSLRIRPVHPRRELDASRLLVSAVLGSRGPLQLRPGLVIHGPDGGFTPEIEAVHRGEALIEI